MYIFKGIIRNIITYGTLIAYYDISKFISFIFLCIISKTSNNNKLKKFLI